MASTQRGQEEQRILHRISAMIADEQALREQLTAQQIDAASEHEQLAALERELNQCWDLLRQRRAKSEAGLDPGEAAVRPASQVEDYLS
ncbi:polyhydroxyalkanoate synthesis regulator phasin [Streptacidiphilus sp. MAP12-16]|uniref:DUF2630 family protein n=1 Tax=Streptacidiphilus sp. MAP12-16 TaxID=3156300 RepID=UPI0035169B8F